MKNLLAITVAGQLKWLEEAISTLQDDLDILVVDDATSGIKEFCKKREVNLVTKTKPQGLTNSWNLAYQYLKQNNYDNCILSNDDVRFPMGFSEGLIDGLKEFDLIGPLTNNPGYGHDCESSPFSQNVRRYIDLNPTRKNTIDIQQILLERYRSSPFKQSKFINGFLLAFSSTVVKFAYNEQYLFDPSNINVGNEFDLASRMQERGGKIGISKISYVFHWKAKTTEKLDKDWGQSTHLRGRPKDYREQLWR